MNFVKFLSGHGRRALPGLESLRQYSADAAAYARRNYANNVSEYNTVIESLIAQRRGNLLRDVYDDMMLDAVQPLRDTFHLLIVGAMKSNRLQDAFFFRDEMKAMGLPPDVNLYNFLISACGRSKNSATAIKGSMLNGPSILHVMADMSSIHGNEALEEMKKHERTSYSLEEQLWFPILEHIECFNYAIVRDMTAAGLGLNKFCYAGLITAFKNKQPTTDETTNKIVELVKQSKGWSSIETSSDGGENERIIEGEAMRDVDSAVKMFEEFSSTRPALPELCSQRTSPRCRFPSSPPDPSFSSTLTSASPSSFHPVELILRQGLHLNPPGHCGCIYLLFIQSPLGLALVGISLASAAPSTICLATPHATSPFRPLPLFHQMHLSAIKANHHYYFLVPTASFFHLRLQPIHSSRNKPLPADPHASSSIPHTRLGIHLTPISTSNCSTNYP
ncbi:hypothetical protein HPP92_016334 [Vanilla planifolia]|uniref:Pentatricopeptide repeat-containing protein n=1 Tax=Vanilla planifolia TaxID=51239 RepID=A0A835URZ9_VANPL|nr:hypothetical protein HPP92_016334 [Vanilla planifolia]